MIDVAAGSSGPKDMTPEAFKRIRGFVAGNLKKYADGGTYDGPLFAPMGRDETDALGGVRQAALPGQLGNASDDLLAQTIRGDFLSPDSNPFMQQYIDAATRPIQQNFDDNELMRRALFNRSGQKIQNSSPFAQAQAKAIGNVSQAIGDTTAKIAAPAYDQERARQTQAVNQAQSNASARFETSQGLLEAEALPRMIQEMGIERGTAEFKRRMDMVRDILSISVDATKATVANESSNVGFGIGPFPADKGGVP